jgi:hypothetical protein
MVIATRRSTFVPLAALLAAGALAATGCGSSAGTSSNGSAGSSTIGPVAEAADVTARAAGAQVALSGNVHAGGLTMTISGQGSFDFPAHEGTFAMSLSGLPEAALRALHTSSVTIDELFKSGSLYVGSPLFAGKLPHGAKWMKLDLATVSRTLGLNPSSLTSGGADPAEYLRELRSAGADVKVVGHEKVRGEETTRYAATVNLQKALEAHGASSKAASEALSKLSSTLGGTNLPVEAWVDGKGLLRKVRIKLSGQAIAADVGVEYFNFGATPAVTAPAASEVFDATGAAAQGLSSSGL